MHKGLWLEDSKKEISFILDRLAAKGYEIMFCRTISEALKYLKDPKYSDLEFLIIDSVLAHDGVYTDNETLNARYTGVRLIDDIRNNRSGLNVPDNIPILLITNVVKDEIIEKLLSKHINIVYLKKMPTVTEIVLEITNLIKGIS